MKTVLRTLLVWLVLLAVPFQGFAAAAMTCAHGMGVAPAGQEAKAPCHGHAAQTMDRTARTAAQDHAQATDDGHAQHKKCGNCAACSVGTAMAPATQAAAPDCCPCNCCPCASQAAIGAADPDLPERPPRT